jgi:transposase-like protein
MDAILTGKAEQLAREIASQATTLEELNGLLKLMMGSALERMLDTEMDVHLGRKQLPGPAGDSPMPGIADPFAEPPRKPRAKNRRNGHSEKTVQGDLGKIMIATPRDRDGTFEPQLIPKHQRRLSGFDEKILALYAKGMTTRDIQEVVKELYNVDVSPTLISEITADLDAQVTAWRTRQVDPVWPIVYLDGIVVHVRGANGRVSAQTMYVALGVNMQGRKELLGLWLGETEGAKFWLSCLTDLKNRGLKDIFISCMDGLSGFPEALRTAYPEAKVQLCIVHLVRAALKYVTDKDSDQVVVDLKKIYQAATVTEAEEALDAFAQAWGQKYPTIVKQWRLKWPDIAAMFEFPLAIRRAIYTTNAIESVNSVIRKFTRNRKQYPNEESALKLVYMAIHEASKKWTLPIPKWREALNHFAIIFEDRLPRLAGN